MNPGFRQAVFGKPCNIFPESETMNPILIRNGNIIKGKEQIRTDVFIEGGKISAIGDFHSDRFRDAEVINALGKLILPGGIDPHVHLALPTPAGNSSDDFISGSQAALAGGTTTMIDFVTPHRGQSLEEAYFLRKAETAASHINCGLHLGISEWNTAIAREIIPMIEMEGIRSFKAYLAYRESIGIGYDELERLMWIAGSAGVLVMVHCEDGVWISHKQQEFVKEGKVRPACHAASRPPETEIRAIEKVIALSAKTGCKAYIVHISTRKGAEMVGAAKKSGIRVYGETCPQYLLLDDSVYGLDRDDMDVLPYVISPPIRGKNDQEGLWEALADGLIDVVSTDHCPFNLHGQKDRGIHDFTRIPNGAGGIEHRLSLLYTYGVLAGRMSLNRFVDLVSVNPAEIFGMGQTKGRIEPGYDADIVIWDPDFSKTISVKSHVQHCDSEIYEGFKVKGRAEKVILDGEIADHKS